MKNIKNLLFYPLLILLLFLFDKIFLWEVVRDHFLQPGGMVFYRHRKELLENLKNHVQNQPKNFKDQKKLFVVLGDSRSLGLGQEVANYIQRKDLDIWNFTAFQAVPAYYFYLAKKILEFHHPDVFLVGVSPDAFNRNTHIFANPVLIFGVDEDFIKKYDNLIPRKDKEIYKKSKLFALAGIQFSMKTLLQRIKGSIFGSNTQELLEKYQIEYNQLTEQEKKLLQVLLLFGEENLSYYVYEKSPHRILMNYTKGAQYAWFGKMSDKDLQEETKKFENLYLKNFTISYEQLIFLELLLDAVKNKSKAVIYIPRVNPYLRNIYSNHPEISFVISQISELSQKYHTPFLNFNDPALLECDDFYDASHLSVSCFPDVLRQLLKALSN
ncbi:MAG: DUF1574 domain-containing protein [Leptospiraceae bacterium]|nr:DUF1574 domain-containing protein [Leptospiraceae bacterium]MDW7976974.1 DUF1574 family protein [Leptospiraceae bacterium]